MRAFVAVELPSRLKTELAAIAETFESPKTTPVGSKAMHITLNFLGDITADQAEQANFLLSKLRHDQFEITVRGIDSFIRPRGAVVFASIVKGYPELCSLHNKTRDLLKDVCQPEEERTFTPHITLARIRDARHQPDALARKELENITLGDFVAKAIYLKKSTLTASGPIYETLSSFPLSEVSH